MDYLAIWTPQQNVVIETNLPVKGLCGRCLSARGPETHTPPQSMINTCRKDPLRSISLDDNILHCLLWVLSFWGLQGSHVCIVCKLEGNKYFPRLHISKVQKTTKMIKFGIRCLIFCHTICITLFLTYEWTWWRKIKGKQSTLHKCTPIYKVYFKYKKTYVLQSYAAIECTVYCKHWVWSNGRQNFILSKIINNTSKLYLNRQAGLLILYLLGHLSHPFPPLPPHLMWEKRGESGTYSLIRTLTPVLHPPHTEPVFVNV